jgi:hypothetical protein
VKKILFCFSLLTQCVFAKSQIVTHYNLAELLKQNKIITVPSHETKLLNDAKKDAITTKGIVWLEGIHFKEGTIDIDLRGKDVFLNSFLGIAFHGTDTSNCDILYFRPFNFKHPDTSRRRWSVAYMSIPNNNYAVLRKAHPYIYEDSVHPVPNPSDWFHATIIIKNKKLSVYVNHADKASLELTLIGDRKEELFGLYSDGLTNDFADLTIAQFNE